MRLPADASPARSAWIWRPQTLCAPCVADRSDDCALPRWTGAWSCRHPLSMVPGRGACVIRRRASLPLASRHPRAGPWINDLVGPGVAGKMILRVIALGPAFDQHRIAEFVGAIAVLHKGGRGAVQHRIVSEGAKELVMAFAGLVHSGEDRIHDAQPGRTPDASTRNTISRTHTAVCVRGGFKRADHRRSDGNDAPAG